MKTQKPEETLTMENPIVKRITTAVMKQIMAPSDLNNPLQTRIEKMVIAELLRLEKRLRKASETNRLLANACRDGGTTKATEAYAEGSAFAFFQSAQIVGGFSK